MSPETPASPVPPAELPIDGADDEIEAAQVLVVRVGAERFAVPLVDLREVVRARPAARMPGAAPWVLGLVVVRGDVIPAGDLARLASPNAETDDAPWFLVVERGARRAALGVSAVEGVHVVAGEAPTMGATSPLPCSHSARLLSQAAGGAQGAPDAADVLDVGALLEELFEGE